MSSEASYTEIKPNLKYNTSADGYLPSRPVIKDGLENPTDPESIQLTENLDIYHSQPTDNDIFDRDIEFLDHYINERLRKERYRPDDLLVADTDSQSPDEQCAKERSDEYLIKRIGKYLMAGKFNRHSTSEDERTLTLDTKLAPHLLEKVMIYFGNNEGWFGQNASVIETSRHKKIDDLNENKTDLMIEVRNHNGSVVNFCIDLTTSEDSRRLRKKSIGTVQNGGNKPGSISRAISENKLVLRENPFDKDDEVSFIPLVICIDHTNTRDIIQSLARNIVYDGKVGEYQYDTGHMKPISGVTETMGNRIDQRAPLVLLILQQIITQLELYDAKLSEINMNTIQRDRHKDIQLGLDYFINIRAKLKADAAGVEPISDRSADLMYNILSNVDH